MTNKELNVIKIMAAIINMSQSIVYGTKDISQLNWNFDGIVYDSAHENKIVASYIPEESMVLEYWEDIYEMSCRLETNKITNEDYIKIYFISDEDEEFDIIIDSRGRII